MLSIPAIDCTPIAPADLKVHGGQQNDSAGTLGLALAVPGGTR